MSLCAGHQADVDIVQWHPNCHYLATASSDRTVRLWDVATGMCTRLLSGLQSAPTSMAISPDGKQMAVGSDDGNILLWDLGSARRMATFTGHAGAVWSLMFSHGLATSPILASGAAS